MRSRIFLGCVVSVLTAAGASADQRKFAGMPAIRGALNRLANTGSVLMIGAHPDDENTALLAYFARGRNVRAAYLSLTRGEGGQNLIGSEQGDLLGVIRTQELLAARRIDGAEQFFTRAIDFGFSKSAEETMAKWGRREVLSDIVWVIRRYRPDVIILRFSGTARDGHGHHQASAILGKEAFAAAADPEQFPEQLRWVKPWQATRLMWNTFSFTPQQEKEAAKMAGRVAIDTGEYDPVLGYSYGEIAGMSRSLHRSQGFGAAERRGAQRNYLVTVAGRPAASDVFDGIDISWKRFAGGAAVGAALERAAREFAPEHPEKVVPLLLKARAALRAVDDPRAEPRRTELDEAIALVTGLWLDASAATPFAAPGAVAPIELTAINRSPVAMELAGVEVGGRDGASGALEYNRPVQRTVKWTVPESAPVSQPFWLRLARTGDRYEIADQRLIGVADSEPALQAVFRVKVDGEEIALARPVWRRYVDRVFGEQTRPFVIVPPVALKPPETALVFPDGRPRTVDVRVLSYMPGARGSVRLAAPAGWRVAPAERAFELAQSGAETAVSFEVTPPAGESRGQLRAVASVGGRELATSIQVIQHEHIPIQTVFPPSTVAVARTDARTLAKSVGYVMGAGDEVPAALAQLGCQVTMLDEKELAEGELARFDAIVTGVRAFNTRADLRANTRRLFDYVNGGGTLVVQYNVLEGGFLAGDAHALDRIGPYPLRIGRERVTVEEAPVTFADPGNALLHKPNEIGPRDFKGWVQERGLYFASEWDPRYQPLFEMHDPGEKPLQGSTLAARYGKGAYVFTGLSFFRELPAGVPGAYRLFANLLSAGKVIP